LSCLKNNIPSSETGAVRGDMIINGKRHPSRGARGFIDGMRVSEAEQERAFDARRDRAKEHVLEEAENTAWSPLLLEGIATEASDETPENQICSICLMNIKNVLLVPCNHICSCVDCARKIESPVLDCPICRGRIERMEVVYF
jgi:hypothetical protein